MYLTDYDPNDPPEPSHLDEIDRCIGIVVGRSIIAAIVMTVVGYDIADGVVGLYDETLLIQLIGLYFTVWISWPMLIGLEHTVVSIKRSWPSWLSRGNG